METLSTSSNPLGTEKVTGLMIKFAIPSIIAMVIGAVYNIVDQLFIGHAVGTLGNAATNVVFPLTTSCTALALLFGIGGSACFNLNMGRGETKKAAHYIGNALVMLVLSGIILCAVAEIFMTLLLRGFGTPDNVFPYAKEYLRVTAIGFPFLILTTGGGHLMRADGSPKMTMICSLTGAILNIFLDALFVLGFDWGMTGAALATIIGQIVSGTIVILYMRGFKTVPLKPGHLRLRWEYVKQITVIGTSPFFNQIFMMVVQIVMNNSLTYYGALSVYGEAIPLACCGIIMKVYQIFLSVIIGLAQGAQPIESFNYGAKKYRRVREAYLTALVFGLVISLASFIFFRLFPRQILEWFGSNTEEYFEFGVLFFKIFMFFTWLNFLQPITANFFTAIGKPRKGVFLSLTRQLIYILPLIIILPMRFGLMGILYSAPIADLLAAVTTVLMVWAELRAMKRLEQAEDFVGTTV
ncbi:MAG: MATE family efflux transporter [Lachnospiraceae bacterium]|nr:MATE family efflux transporter [Lachnospiraceae bacterium]